MQVPPNSCYLSPANSFGFMDGGIDAVYSIMFPDIQDMIQENQILPLQNKIRIIISSIGSSILIDLNLLNSKREMKLIPLDENVV